MCVFWAGAKRSAGFHWHPFLVNLFLYLGSPGMGREVFAVMTSKEKKPCSWEQGFFIQRRRI